MRMTVMNQRRYRQHAPAGCRQRAGRMAGCRVMTDDARLA